MNLFLIPGPDKKDLQNMLETLRGSSGIPSIDIESKRNEEGGFIDIYFYV